MTTTHNTDYTASVIWTNFGFYTSNGTFSLDVLKAKEYKTRRAASMAFPGLQATCPGIELTILEVRHCSVANPTVPL